MAMAEWKALLPLEEAQPRRPPRDTRRRYSNPPGSSSSRARSALRGKVSPDQRQSAARRQGRFPQVADSQCRLKRGPRRAHGAIVAPLRDGPGGAWALWRR